jgi:oxygen-dependent protoporphyrinogen oxidase
VKRVVIIGGGIAGLSAAFRAHDLFGADAEANEVLLLEERGELGGKLRTESNAGHLLEGGPNAFIDPGPELAELVARAGVEVMPADAAAKRRFLCKQGVLHEVQTNPIALLKSGLLSAGAKLRALAEPTIGKRSRDANGDESVEAFFTRRFGAKMSSVFAAPLVSGIYAGDPARLSLSSCFPRLAVMEEEHGSIVKGMMALRKEGVKVPTLHTPAEGMQSIPRGLGEAAAFEVRTGVAARSIAPREDAWELTLSDGEVMAADGLVIATPAAEAARLLEPVSELAAASLSKIPYPHLAVVSLVYVGEQAAHAPKAFGALFVHDNSSDLLGVIHESHVFPARSSEGSLNLRVMLGGATRPDLGGRSDEELLKLVTEELASLHGLTSPPLISQVTRWKESIPQYNMGHAEGIELVRSELRESTAPPLALAGNYLSGISLSDTTASGAQAAEQLHGQLTG